MKFMYTHNDMLAWTVHEHGTKKLGGFCLQILLCFVALDALVS